ncbi:MAG: NusG domain II-containing protein [Solirubrobacterales bacterium]
MKKGDKITAVIIAAVIIISSVGVFAYMKLNKSSHHIAEIKQDGKVIKTIDLDKVAKAQEIKIPYGTDDYNIVFVEKGKIRVSDADCPDKLCVKAGCISQSGQNIVCLPHRLIISIQGGSKDVDENVY